MIRKTIETKKREVKRYRNGNVKYSNIDGIEKWFDEEGKLTRYRNSDGFESTYKYNEGKLCQTIDCKGFERIYINGKVIHGTDINGYEFDRRYDSDGNPVYFKDNKGHTETRVYDSLTDSGLFQEFSNSFLVVVEQEAAE